LKAKKELEKKSLTNETPIEAEFEKKVAMANRQSIEFLQQHAEATKFPLQLSVFVGGDASSSSLAGSHAQVSHAANVAAFAHLDDPDENDSASLLTADLSFIADEGHGTRKRGPPVPPRSTTLTCPVRTRDHVEAVCALMTLLGANAQHMYWQIFHREVIQQVSTSGPFLQTIVLNDILVSAVS